MARVAIQRLLGSCRVLFCTFISHTTKGSFGWVERPPARRLGGHSGLKVSIVSENTSELATAASIVITLVLHVLVCHYVSELMR